MQQCDKERKENKSDTDVLLRVIRKAKQNKEKEREREKEREN